MKGKAGLSAKVKSVSQRAGFPFTCESMLSSRPTAAREITGEKENSKAESWPVKIPLPTGCTLSSRAERRRSPAANSRAGGGGGCASCHKLNE